SSDRVTRSVPPLTGVPVTCGRGGGFPGQAASKRLSAIARSAAAARLFLLRRTAPVVEREVTGRHLAGVMRQQLGFLILATRMNTAEAFPFRDLSRARAARMEPASRGRVDGRRHIALQDDPLALHPRIWDRNGSQ